MTRMFKYVTLLVLVLTLNGCGQQEVADVVAEPEKSQGVSSNVAAATAPLQVALPGALEDNIAQQAAVNEVIRQNMQASYAQVKMVSYPAINVRDVESIKAFVEELKAEAAPDVIVVTTSTGQMLAELGAFLPLDKSMSERLRNYEGLVYKSAARSVRWQGQTVGIPRTIDPNMIIYNKAHFAEANVKPDPRWNWEEFAATSVKVSEGARAVFSQLAQEGKRLPPRATSVEAAGVLCATQSCWLPFLLSNGGGFLEVDPENILIDSEASIEALFWLQAQYSKGTLQGFVARPVYNPSTTASFGPAQLSRLYWLNEKEDLYGALPFPKSPYIGRSVTTVSTTMYAVSAYTHNVDLAIDFILAALSLPAQEKLVAETGLIAARKDAKFPPVAWFPPKEVLDVVLDNAWSWPPEYIGNRYVYKLNFNELILQRESPEELARTAARELQQILDKKDTPEKYEPATRDPNTNWFGGPKTTPVKSRQDPPPPGFSGVTVRWVGSSYNEKIALLDAFNAKSAETGIYVDLLDSKELDGYTPAGYFRKSLAEGKPVDLITGGEFPVADMVKEGFLEPLDHYLRFDLPTIPDGGVLHQAKFEGRLFEIPMFRVPELVWVRKDAWERAGFAYPTDGWGWGDFWLWTQKAMDLTKDIHGVAISQYKWRTLFYQMGSKLATGPYENLDVALQVVKRFLGTYPKVHWAKPYGPSMEDLTAGKAVAYVGPANFPSAAFVSPLNTILDEAGLMALPLPTASGELTGAGSTFSTIMVLKEAPNKEAAIEFVRWMLSAEASPYLKYLRSGRLPVAMYPETYEGLAQFFGPQVKSVLPVPYVTTNENHPHIGQLSNVANTYANEYFAGEKGLLETVANISADLPLIAQGGDL